MIPSVIYILQKCGMCGMTGASVGCNAGGCKANYHFVCAQNANAVFLQDKKVFCQHHGYFADTAVSSIHCTSSAFARYFSRKYSLYTMSICKILQ